MLARSTLLRALKFSAKAISGLLAFLLIAIVLLHLPPIQRLVTPFISDYLSSKLHTRVEIERLEFSLLGDIGVEDLTVWGADNDKILIAKKIQITSNSIDLLLGHYIFETIRLSGVRGQFVEREDGWNIQAILDAFQPTNKSDSPKHLELQFNSITLENISVFYSSIVNGTTVTTDLGTFTIRHLVFTNDPNAITADHALLQHTAVSVLSTAQQAIASPHDTTGQVFSLAPGLGLNINLAITAIEMKDNDFSFHKGQLVHTPKFDPAHIELTHITGDLANILVREDTLAAVITSVASQFPGFSLTQASSTVRLNHNTLALSGLHVGSNDNDLQAEFKGWSDSSLRDDHLECKARARVDPNALRYFMSDSLLNHFAHWGAVELMLEGNYVNGKGDVKMIGLKTKDSQLQAKGMAHNVRDYKKLRWNDVTINASIGPDLEKTLVPFLPSMKLPPRIDVNVASSGNAEKMFVDGKLYSSWGNVNTEGFASLRTNDVKVDMNLTGRRVIGGNFIDMPWLGATSLSMHAGGVVGRDPDIDVKGLVDYVEIEEEPIHKIAFQSKLKRSGAVTFLTVADTSYRAKITSEILYAGPLTTVNHIQLDSFRLGRLLHGDSTLSVSGDFNAKLKIDQSILEGELKGNRILFKNHTLDYSLDTLATQVMISPTASRVEYFSDDGKGSLAANYDIRKSSDILQVWSKTILNSDTSNYRPTKDRMVRFDLQLQKASLLSLLGIAIDDFSSLTVAGEYDEQKQATTLQASSGKFKGYGASIDTLSTTLHFLRDNQTLHLNARNLYYENAAIGDVDFDMLAKQDTAITQLRLSNDSSVTLAFRSRVSRSGHGIVLYPDNLSAFGNDYSMDHRNPVYIENGNVVFQNFMISRNTMQIRGDGNLQAFNLALTNLDLKTLNTILAGDSTIINQGRLNATISYIQGQQINLKANVDSLRLFNSKPLTIEATAVSDKTHVPFEFLLTNEANKIDIRGQYQFGSDKVNASMLVDIHNLEIFGFLLSGIIDQMRGAVKGEATIGGSIQKPDIDGHLRFSDAVFTTSNPRLTFLVQDDVIALDDSVIVFKDFKVYDQQHHPLTVNGSIVSKDYRSLRYDLQLHTDDYALLNNRDSVDRPLRGLLVVASDMKLTGTEKDTYVKADVTIKDKTSLIFQSTTNEIKLLTSNGIVDFIDPALLTDGTSSGQSPAFYDSLIATLPDFNLNSTVKIEDNATLRVVIDPQSGDFIEASGGGNLEMDYDRTGNIRLSGSYAIKKGVYRVSFYELAKKNFSLVPGSTITWSGSPENGDLDIRAVHTIRSSSIGLIGNEIGESEQSIYKRPLPYEVGITIKGTIKKPLVSFSLDLPQEDKVNYPVLATKLDRLKQPEFQSELNKQVFGILVLGGFIPETSGADISQNVATTALSNSVNSLLSNQLNRFASRYIKGVDIDVGIQSYSDYTAPGGKTQTAMDFRVTKRMMNERLSFEIGGDFNINQDQSGANTGDKNFRGDIAIIYDLTGNGNKKLKLFNNETFDIIYQEVKNTGISLIFIREFNKKPKDEDK